MSKTIFSVELTDESTGEAKINYLNGNAQILTVSLVGACIRNKELRESFFNAMVNAIAISEHPQEWLDSVNNGVKMAVKHAKVEFS